MRAGTEARGGIFEFRIVSRDGGTKYVELSAGRISYQGKPASLVILRDVTDRRRTEEELSLTLGEAIHEITKNRGTLYDPDAVDACKLLFIEGRFAFKG